MTTGGERSDRVRRSMASRRSSSRSCASSSVRGTMPGAVPSGNVSPVVGSKAGVTCPPVSCVPSAARVRAAAAASSAARVSMSCTRWPSSSSARSPAIPSASMSESGSVGTDEKHDCMRNAPPRTTAKRSAPIRVIHEAENAPAAGAVSRVQLGIASFQVVEVNLPSGAVAADLQPAGPDKPAHDQQPVLL